MEEVQGKMENLIWFVELTEEARRVLDSAADERTKYDVIFSSAISGKIDSTGIAVNWRDPESTYLEDATAYVRVLEEKAKELRLVLRAVGKEV